MGCPNWGFPRRSKLVFANSNSNKYTRSWDDCVEIAERAKVQDAHPHKFRATFATRNLQKGVDLKTVQALLGHKDIESTMRYLAKADSKKMRGRRSTLFGRDSIGTGQMSGLLLPYLWDARLFVTPGGVFRAG
jgi:integrase